MRYVLTALLTLLVLAPRPAVAQAIPQLSTWESQMVTYGTKHGEALKAWLAGYQAGDPIDDGLLQTYYDRQRVMRQIAAYRAEITPWLDYADDAERVYRDLYVRRYCPSGSYACIPGYWNFSTGLGMDADPTSVDTVVILAQSAAYCSVLTDPAATVPWQVSREVAECIQAFVNAQALGQSQDAAQRTKLVNDAYGHLDQLVTQQVWRGTTDQVSPFIIAITLQALIRDWEQTADPRLLPILQASADFMWSTAWVAESQAMLYDVNPESPTGSTSPAPDLNLIIAPVYGWLYAQTGDVTARDRGDALFAGGVTQAWLDEAKQFNQNYWWSFDFVRWRQ